MTEYVDHKGILLDRFEWFGGHSIRDKAVRGAQSARHREVKKGGAKVVDPKLWDI